MKYLSSIKIYILLLITVFFAFNQKGFSANEIYSTAKGGLSNPLLPGGTFTYCIGDASDLIYALSPNNKDFTCVLNPAAITDANPTDGQALFNPVAAGAGSWTVSYNGKNYNFVVTAAPVLTSATNGIVCSGVAQNYTITTAPVTTYSWTRAAVAGITPATGSGATALINETLVNSTTAPISVTYVITSGCTTFTYDVTVNPTPAINSALTATVCSGTPLSYSITSNTDVAFTTYVWSRAAFAGISNAAVAGQTTSTITETLINTTGNPVNNVKYLITPTYGGCSGATFTLTVTVNAAPAMTSSTTGSICSEIPQAYTITTNPTPTTISWTRPVVAGISNGVGAGAGSSIAETLTNTTTGAIPVVYNITMGSTGCTTATYTVTVKPKPTLTFAALPSVCETSSIIDLETYVSPISGTFTAPVGVNSATSEFDPTTVPAPSTQVITYTYTEPATTCTNTATQSITTNPNPSIVIPTDLLMNGSPAASLSTDHCLGDNLDSFTYTPITGAGGTGVFTAIPGVQNDGITDAGGGNATFNPGAAGLGYHDVVYTYTTTAGCSSTEIINVRVGTKITLLGLASSYCSNLSTASFIYSHWSAILPHTLTLRRGAAVIAGLTDNGSNGDGTGTATFSPSALGVGSYTIQYDYTDDLTCVNTITVPFSIIAATSANFTGFNATLTYCDGDDPVDLSGNVPNLVLGESSLFSGPGVTDLGVGTGTFSPSALAAGATYPVTNTFTNSSGCTDIVTKNVTVAELPIAYAVTGTGSYCQGSGGLTVTLSGSQLDGVNYQYQLLKGGIADGASVPGTGAPITWLNKTAGTYTVEATYVPTGCKATMSGSAILTELAQAIITVPPIDVSTCENGSAVFSLTATGQNLTYQWKKGGVNIVGATSNILALNNVPLTDNNTTYTCTVTSTCPAAFTSTTPAKNLTVNTLTSITTPPANKNACSGNSHTFTVVAAGVNNTYKWYKGVTLLSDNAKYINTTTASLTILNLTTADAGVYTCYVLGDCGSEVQTAATLTVDAPIVITTHPVSIDACTGSNVAFNTVATGTNLTYQWQKNGVNIGGATNSSYSISGVAAGDAASYRCVITSPCGATQTTSSATLTIPVTTGLTSFTSSPADGTICSGGNANFSVVATGAALQYSWYKDGSAVALTDDAVISNTTSANLTFTSATAANTGSYTVKVTGTCGTVNATGNLVVKQPVVFTTQPLTQTLCAGSGVTLSVVVTGDVSGYQWQKWNGVAFVNEPGVTNSTYTMTPAVAGIYQCVVSTTSCGTYTSSQSTLTVTPTTTIAANPVSQNACVGSTVSFSVAASGSGLSYQWYKNLATMGAGYTNSSLTLTNIATTDAGSYTCTVSGACGPAVTTPVAGVLTVDVAPVISNQPQSASVCSGASYNLAVTLSAGTNPVYQWYFDKDGATGPIAPVAIALGTNQILSIVGFAAANDGFYYVTVTNGCGTVTSQMAKLSLSNAVTVTTHPTLTQTVCEGGTATFSVVANQTDITYQWSKNGTNIAGANASNLILNNVTTADAGKYRCTVTNGCGNVISNEGELFVVGSTLTMVTQPINRKECLGTTFSLTALASSSIVGETLTYTWFKVGTALSVGTGNTFTFAGFLAAQAGTYYCVVTNGCASITSGSAIVSVGDSPTAAAFANQTICEGGEVTFTVGAYNANLTYQWFKGAVALSNNARISGATSNTLVITGLVDTDQETYSCTVAGSCGLPVTQSAVLGVTVRPVIDVQPISRTTCNGTNVDFSVLASGENLSYQWKIFNSGTSTWDNVPLASATSATLHIDGATTSAVYHCVITNSCGFITTNAAELIVESNLAIVSHPASITRCEGSNATFTVNATGPANTTYQWYKDDGTPSGEMVSDDARISGSNLATLSINNVAASDANTYWCYITSSCGNTNSNQATLDVQERIIIAQQPVGVTVCPATALNLGVNATGFVTGFQWQINQGAGWNNIPGATSQSYIQSPFVPATHAGSYRCLLTNTCETVTSDVAVVSTGVLTTASIVGNVAACQDGSATLAVTSAGSDLTYTWLKGGLVLSDNGKIVGSTTPNLTINNLAAADAGTYKCEVTGSCGIDNDNTPVLTVNEKLTFTTQPVSTSVVINNAATFTVAVSGAVTGYQWYKGSTLLTNGADYTGVTTASLTVLNSQMDDAGTYKCLVFGTCGNVESQTADLSVIPTSIITTQPTTPLIICEDNAINLSVVSSGTTFQWRYNNVDIAGATSSTLNINLATPAQSGAYTCVVDNSEISAASMVTVNPKTRITNNPVAGNLCEDDTHIFSVTATGTALTYQWYKDLASLGATAQSADYTITPLTTAHSGNYYCTVNGTCGTLSSSIVNLTVNSKTVVNAQPTIAGPVCEGTSPSLVFNVSGSNLTYLWKKNGLPITDANISGLTGSTLLITGSVPSNSGNYTCTVTGACGSAITSDVVAVTINPTTVITAQPIGRTKCDGDGVVFTVEAIGANLTYSWNKDGLPIVPAETATTLTINGLVKSNQGTYTCDIQGTCGIITTTDAVLTVNSATSIAAPTITTNPICQNGSTQISIAATGDGLTYLWKKNGLAITGTNISGQTDEDLIISNALISDAGVYTSTVTGLCGSPLTSSNIVLSVNPTTAITAQPLNYTRCAGTSSEVLFTVSATGSNLTYQWKKGGSTGPNVVNGLQASGAFISGATTNQLSITGITATEAGSYVCIISGTCGNLSTVPAVLTVNEPVQITTQPPVLTNVCQGESPSITLQATGSSLTYKWKLNGTYLNNDAIYSGVTTNTLTISNASLAEAGFYSCDVEGTCNIVYSQSSELFVTPTAAITLHPIGTTVCEGDNVQLNIAAVGATPLNYQWKKGSANVGTNSNILTLPNILAADAGGYYCIVTGATCGTATSNVATIAVNPKITISQQPVNQTICDENTAIFLVNATGTLPLTYRWKYNLTNYLTDDARISGSNTNELTVSLATKSDEGIYQCEILSTCGSNPSNQVILTVTDSTKIVSHPVNQTLLVGSPATFNVSATGSGLSYQWEINTGAGFTPIGGATLSSYTIPGVALTDAGQYRCMVTGTCGTFYSNIALLTVNELVTIITQPVALTKCVNDNASFTVVASGTVVSYQWKLNGTDITDGAGISGANTQNLVIASVNTTHAGIYSCVVTGSNNIANSNSVQLTVNSQVVITKHPITQSKCNGDILVLEVLPNNSTFSYSWVFNGNPLVNGGRISGATSSKLVITGVTDADAGTYRCTVSNNCNSETSNPAIVTINPVVSITSEPSNLTRCEGQTAFFSVVSNSSTASYQWYKNGSVISNSATVTGATTANLIIYNITLTDAGSYSCRVSDECTYDNSIVVQLTVKNKTVIQSQPENVSVCEGNVAFFEVKAIPSGLNYRWQKNGANMTDLAGKIEGSANSILVVRNTTIADTGVYRCVITGGCNDEITNPSSLTINLLPAAAGTVSGDNVVCQGETNVLYVVPTIANATSYVWDLPYGATIASGAGTRSVTVNYSNTAQSGVVNVFGQNSCGNGTISLSLPVTVNAKPLALAGNDQIVCGASTTLGANAVAGQWSIASGDALIANVNQSNTSVNNMLQGQNRFVWTVTQSGCSASDTVTINNATVTVNAGTDQIVCSKTARLQAVTPLNGAFWTVSGGSGTISQITSPSSLVSNLTQGDNHFAWTVNNLGCLSSDVVTITNDQPLFPNGGPNQVIAIDETTLDAIPTESGTTGTWLALSGGGTFVEVNNPKTQVTDIPSGLNIYAWKVQRNNCILADTVLITNIMIDIPEAGPDQTICETTTRLEAVRPEIGTGEWSVIIGTAVFADKYNPETQVSNLGFGQNWLRWTVRSSGLGVASDSVLIINNKTSVANAGPDAEICANTFTLNANTPVYGTGLWTVNSGAGNILILNDAKSVISNLSQGINELKWTITNANCFSEDFVKITNNIPSTANAGDDQIVCFDSTLLIPNTPSIGTGSWSIVSGSGDFVGNYVKNLSSDVNVFQYTISNGNCRSVDNVTITNNKPTTPNAGYDKKICADSVNLGANIATQGLANWSLISGSGTFSNPNIHNPLVRNIGYGNNRYRYTITKNGCEEFDEIVVSNNYIQASAGDDVVLCTNQYQLLASNPTPGKGIWSVVGASGATFKNPTDPNTFVTNLSNGQNNLRWTVDNQGCISTDEVSVSNFKPTDAAAGENQAVCSKQARLAANSPLHGEGRWLLMSGVGTFDDDTDPNTTVRNLGEGVNILRWVITQENCLSYDDVQIVSNLPEKVFAGNDQIACSDTAVLSATTPSIGSGQWTIVLGAGNFDNPRNPQTVIRNLGKGQNILKWTVSSSDCHVMDTVIITSNITNPSIAGADQILCSDATILAGNTPTVGTGQWVLVSGSAVIETPNSPNSRVSSIQLGNTTLRWIISLNGCYSYDEITLVNNQPSNPFAGYDTEICGDSVRLFANPPTVGTGRWTLVSGDAVIITPDSNQTQVVNIKFNDNTFRYTVTHKNCVLSDDVIITSNYEYVNAGEDRQVNTPSIQLIGNVPAQGQPQWRVSASPATLVTPNSFETQVTGLGSGANIFTYTVTNNGCTSTDDVIINYVVMPVANFDASQVKGCPPMLVNFINTSIGGLPYHWDFGDGETSTEASVMHVYDNPGIYKAVLTATAPLGLVVTKDTFITVYELPVANFDIAPDTIYVPGEHISCFNYSENTTTSQWFFGDGTYITEFAPVYSYTEPGIYDITLKAISSEGCVDSMTILDAVQVLPRSDFFFPSAFTPNSTGGTGGVYDLEDRSNDVFYPIVVDGELNEYELMIFNRQGVMVFKSNDVNIGWDGYYKGKRMPQDVYVYLIQGKFNNGLPFKQTGNVLLIQKEN